jgi:hypothetical protein
MTGARPDQAFLTGVTAICETFSKGLRWMGITVKGLVGALSHFWLYVPRKDQHTAIPLSRFGKPENLAGHVAPVLVKHRKTSR